MTSSIRLADTHAHLSDPRLGSRLDEVLLAATDAGVERILAVGIDVSTSEMVVEVAGRYPQVHAAVGIHPNDASEATDVDWSRIEALARRPRVAAIGETGLDRHWDRTPFPIQQDYFGRHLALAFELDLPVVIHSRDCHRDVVDQLAGLGRPVKGVLHSFTGTWAEAEELLSLGLYLSFAGMITFNNKSLDPLREAAARVPIDRLLVETDSPYLSPTPHRGKTNEPSRVVHTATRVAEVRDVTVRELAEATSRNAARLFGW